MATGGETNSEQRPTTQDTIQDKLSDINALHPNLPELPYPIKDHGRNIIIIWTLFTLDSAVLPLLLFYVLWYDTSESVTNILTITTCIFGLFASFQWAMRTWKLWSVEEVRPLGGQRKGLDFFHYAHSIGYGIGIVELIGATAPDRQLVRLCALPTPSFVLYFGLILLLTSFLCARGGKAPFRLSSIAKGEPIRPTIYTIVEDVIAVDTGTGRRYREALNARYEASPRFRRMLVQLNLFWGLGAVSFGVATIVAMYMPHVPRTVGYGIGWAVPPIWAMIWAVITTLWVQSSLRKEKAEWGTEEKV